jgi:hypothetical protein
MSQTFSGKKVIHRVEIPMREGTNSFEKVYREEALSGLLSKSDLDIILNEANKLICEAFIKKKENDDIKLPRFLVLITIASVLLGIAYVGLLIIAILYKQDDEHGRKIIIYFATICLLSSTTIIFLLSIYNYCRTNKNFKTIQAYIEEDLNFFFENLNKRYEDVLNFSYDPKREAILINTFKKTGEADNLRNTLMNQDNTIHTRSNSYNRISVDYSAKSII